MPYRRALMTHISHSRVEACVDRHTLAYSIGGDRCDVAYGKTLGLINASKPILGSYMFFFFITSFFRYSFLSTQASQ